MAASRDEADLDQMTQTPPTRRWRHKLLAPLAIGCVASHRGERSARLNRRPRRRSTAATASFIRVRVADRAGYQRFVDVDSIACIDMPGIGGMGIHYVNGELVDDANLNPRTPEAMVYRPVRRGQLRLGAVEYIVFQGLWTHGATSRRRWSGRRSIHAELEPLRVAGLLLVARLVWKHNSAGTFAMFNPDVHCRL